MSLYDIIDEVAERRSAKTGTGETLIHGVMLGIVAQNYHKEMGGRICVTIPTRDEGANVLQWARLAMPSSGAHWGHYFLPEVGDQVLLAFEGGNIEKPYVIGCVPKDSNQFLSGSVDQDNQYKRIVTKHGSTITFEDSSQGDQGEKDKITIQTAGKAHTILLDNAQDRIRITDKKGDNFIELGTAEGSGSLTIKVKSRISIEVGDTIQLVLNGESGSVKLNAQQVNTESSNQFMVKTDGVIKLEAAQISEQPSAMYKLESGGMVSIGGSPIKIGG